MKKVEYKDCLKAKGSYLQIFQLKLTEMQINWENLQNTNIQLQQFPTNIQDVLIGDFHQLVQWYNLFMGLPLSTREILNNVSSI